MRTLGGYFYVYVFAFFFIGFAAVVASEPRGFTERLRPAIIGAADVLEQAEVYLEGLDKEAAVHDAIAIYVSGIRLPSSMLAQVEAALEKAHRRMARN